MFCIVYNGIYFYFVTANYYNLNNYNKGEIHIFFYTCMRFFFFYNYAHLFSFQYQSYDAFD